MKSAALLSLLFLGCVTAASQQASSDAVVEYDLSCFYTADPNVENRTQNQIDFEWDRYEQCARLDRKGRMEINPEHLERVKQKDGLASVLVEIRGWYYVRPDGTSLNVLNFDASPDRWSEGLARGQREGKIVFFNRSFEEATGHRYDWAWPFENGHALVCQGCSLEDSDREHRAMVGGQWWFIDHAGNRVERDRLSEEEIARLDRLARRGELQ